MWKLLDLKVQNLENENKEIKNELKEIKNENKNLKNIISDLVKKQEDKIKYMNEQFLGSIVVENNDEKKQIFNWINPVTNLKLNYYIDVLLIEIVYINFMKNMMEKVQQ